MKNQVGRLVVACVLAVAVARVPAADQIESRPLSFAKGATSATVKGSIKGYKIVDYKLRAKAGQTMRVALKTGNTATYFNVLPPGSNDVAIFIGSTSGNEWAGALPADGNYTIRIYMMRSAARRNEAADYTLDVSIGNGAGGTGTASPMGPAPTGDARVKGTRYHATGAVPCSMGAAPEGSAQCGFGVIRGKPGNADVHVVPPGGFERVLIFRGATVTATGGASVRASKNGDTWSVDVNDYEHYRIPEAVISGG